MATDKIKAIKNGQVKEFGVVQWARLAKKEEGGQISHDGWEETDAPLKSQPFTPAEIRSNNPAKKKNQDASPAENGDGSDAESEALKNMADAANGTSKEAPAKKGGAAKKKSGGKK